MYDKPIYWNEELGADANDYVGKKCANLGEMTRLGVPVPEGFVLSIKAYDTFMQETGARKKVDELLVPILSTDSPDLRQVDAISKEIQEFMSTQHMPPSLHVALKQYYEELCDKVHAKDVPVAVRSSGIMSMPGQMDTQLNVRGAENVSSYTKKIWASGFTSRAIFYRHNHKSDGMTIQNGGLGVAILRMVEARSAGVGFTANPVTGDRSKVMIEGNWGLGESIVQSLVTPDVYYIDKKTMAVQFELGEKTKWYALVENGSELRELPLDKQKVPSFSEAEAIEAVKWALMLEKHFDYPQDFEWAVDDRSGKLYLVQVRPIKNLPDEKKPTDIVLDMLLQRMSMK